MDKEDWEMIPKVKPVKTKKETIISQLLYNGNIDSSIEYKQIFNLSGGYFYFDIELKKLPQQAYGLLLCLYGDSIYDLKTEHKNTYTGNFTCEVDVINGIKHTFINFNVKHLGNFIKTKNGLEVDDGSYDYEQLLMDGKIKK